MRFWCNFICCRISGRSVLNTTTNTFAYCAWIKERTSTISYNSPTCKDMFFKLYKLPLMLLYFLYIYTYLSTLCVHANSSNYNAYDIEFVQYLIIGFLSNQRSQKRASSLRRLGIGCSVPSQYAIPALLGKVLFYLSSSRETPKFPFVESV